MVCGERDNNKGFCGFMLWWSCVLVPAFVPLRGSRKENYSNTSKVYYPRCVKTMDRARLR